jgi:hypothetical protein
MALPHCCTVEPCLCPYYSIDLGLETNELLQGKKEARKNKGQKQKQKQQKARGK